MAHHQLHSTIRPASVILPLIFLASCLTRAHAGSTPLMLRPQEMVWHGDATVKNAYLEGAPGAVKGLFTVRIELPGNFMIPPHFHPCDEHITVIRGTMNMGLGDTFDRKATKAFPAGSFILIPKGRHHFAWTRGRTIFQIHGVAPWGMTYVHPKDYPHIMTSKEFKSNPASCCGG